MKRPSLQRVVATVLAPAMLSAVLVGTGFAAEWLPIQPSELAMKSPLVDPNADAEAIFWDVRVVDSWREDVFTSQIWQYLRIKVFTERGKEMQSRVDIPYERGALVDEIAARTISPDGKVTELKRVDLFERVLLKAGRRRIHLKSFVPPGVEAGSIIEYRWRERRLNSGGSAAFDLQRDIPVQHLTYRFHPIVEVHWSCEILKAVPTIVSEPEWFKVITLTNVRAYQEEPDMPPEYESRAWLLTFYTTDDSQGPVSYWRNVGRRAYAQESAEMLPSADLHELATTIVGAATTAEQKLERLHTYCRSRIRNLQADESGLSEEARDKLTDHKSARQTLADGQGTRWDILIVFGALARSLGFDARVAHTGNRQWGFVRRNSMSTLFMNEVVVAVRVGDAWRFYDPSAGNAPAEMLPWQLEGEDALIPAPDEPSWVQTPTASAPRSCLSRTGEFRLSGDGALRGNARIELSGQFAIEQRENFDELSPEARENMIREGVQARWPAASVDNIKIESLGDADRPLVITFEITALGYGQVTSKRLIFAPGVFQYGAKPHFPAGLRENPVSFHFQWTEYDSVVIQVPEGYELEDAPALPDHPIADVGDHRMKLSTLGPSAVVYQRWFDLHHLNYRSTAYPALKVEFDSVHDRDGYTLSLLQKTPASATQTSH